MHHLSKKANFDFVNIGWTSGTNRQTDRVRRWPVSSRRHGLVCGKSLRATKLAGKDAQTNQTGPTSIVDSKGKSPVIGLHYPNLQSHLEEKNCKKKGSFLTLSIAGRLL